MTPTSAPATPAGLPRPGPRTPVLAGRPLRPGTRPETLSVFADRRWDLTPGVFEDHAIGVTVCFDAVGGPWRDDVKTYFWLLVNHPDPPTPARWARTARLALSSLPLLLPPLGRLLTWCDSRGVTSLGRLDAAALDLFLAHLHGLECSAAVKARVIGEVRRLWSYRTLLPPALRLPDPLPWAGEDNRDLLGTTGHATLENRTPRIGDPTLVPLLAWAVRFVTDLAGDITAAYRQWAPMSSQTVRTARRATPTGRAAPTPVAPQLSQLLATLAERGLGLPGRLDADGHRHIDCTHLARLTGRCAADIQRHHDLLAASGLPVEDGAYLLAPITAHLDGAPWRARPVTFTEAPGLARHLSTACFIVIAYLSGMRPGEVLSLQRGAAHHDPATGLWLLHGRHWKDATGADGAKLPEGATRADPWVVHEVTATAVTALERLHDHTRLFPDTLFVGERRRDLMRRAGRARPDKSINRDLAAFTAWVNRYCRATGRTDTVPDDPSGPLTSSRFRRTLAWHLVRQPRGLVAAAIQYGHLRVRITQGYAGSADSGFLDDLCFEDWLARLDQFAEAHRRLATGEHVSGPAAAEYHRRVGEAHARFAGRTLRTTRQARQLVADPALQVFPGQGMHCVFDATTALCQLRPGDDHRATPDTGDCRPRCPNIARTDGDITALHGQLHQLDAALADPLAPAPRRARQQARADRLRAVLARHGQHPAPETP